MVNGGPVIHQGNTISNLL